MRWLVIRAGEAEFIRVARPTFKNHEPAIDFTPLELAMLSPYRRPIGGA